MDKYECMERIGHGAYADVFKAKVTETGQIVAVKKSRPIRKEEGVPTSFIREIENLKMLSGCKHIIKLLAVETQLIEDEWLFLYLVFEFMDGDLFYFYDRCNILNVTPIPPIVIKNMMQQLLKGVEYCHRHGVMHRDLKPQNLLLDMGPGVLKIADFGFCRAIGNKSVSYTEDVITLWYRPPEMLLGERKYTFAVDIWSVGCIFAELCLMTPLFVGSSQVSQLIEIFQLLGTPNEDAWPGVSHLNYWNAVFPKFKPKKLEDEIPNLDECGLDLLSKMLLYDPSKRISASEALSHPYFFGFDSQPS